jgi:hypothetical protein
MWGQASTSAAGARADHTSSGIAQMSMWSSDEYTSQVTGSAVAPPIAASSKAGLSNEIILLRRTRERRRIFTIVTSKYVSIRRHGGDARVALPNCPRSVATETPLFEELTAKLTAKGVELSGTARTPMDFGSQSCNDGGPPRT